MENVIKLNKRDTLKLKIQTDEGVDTGEYLEFDLTNIELPLIYQELVFKDKKNRDNLRSQLMIIEKRQDVKTKGIFTRNEEDALKALNEFFNKEKEVYNMFLGERGVEKLLNGRKFSWDTLEEIDKIIEEQIQPHLNLKMKSIQEQIKEKYNNVNKNTKEVLE